MNNVFKVIYDKSSGKYVVASELAKSGKKAKNIMATATVATVSAFLLQGNALADATPPLAQNSNNSPLPPLCSDDQGNAIQCPVATTAL